MSLLEELAPLPLASAVMSVPELVRLRHRYGLTVRQLADKSGIAEGYLRSIEAYESAFRHGTQLILKQLLRDA